VVPVDSERLQIISDYNSDANVIGICVFESPSGTYLSSIKDLIDPVKDVEGSFHSYHDNKVGLALYTFMERIGLLELKPNIHVESYNDILSERVISCLTSQGVTISLIDGKLILEPGYSSERSSLHKIVFDECRKGIQDAKSLVGELDQNPEVLLKADKKSFGSSHEGYDVVLDLVYWDERRRTEKEVWGATAPKVIKALVWGTVLLETIRAAECSRLGEAAF
jgi:hypothetical protein